MSFRGRYKFNSAMKMLGVVYIVVLARQKFFKSLKSLGVYGDLPVRRSSASSLEAVVSKSHIRGRMAASWGPPMALLRGTTHGDP